MTPLYRIQIASKNRKPIQRRQGPVKTNEKKEAQRLHPAAFEIRGPKLENGQTRAESPDISQDKGGKQQIDERSRNRVLTKETEIKRTAAYWRGKRGLRGSKHRSEKKEPGTAEKLQNP